MTVAPPVTSARYLRYLDFKRIGRRLRCDLGRQISRLGERLNRPSLIYNRLIFAHFNWLARQSAPSFVRMIGEHFPDARRLIDVGAGTGAYVAEFSRAGKEIIGIEHSPLARRMAAKQGADVRRFDLTQPEPAALDGRTFDLAYCLEVAEHLPPEMGDRLVEYIATLAPVVVWTAAQPPWRGGIGHINEQPRQYWIDRFVARGMTYREDLTVPLRHTLEEKCKDAWWLSENVSVFTRP